MTINLTPEQEKIVKEELESGHFRTAEELISQALRALRATAPSSDGGVENSSRRKAVREILRAGHPLTPDLGGNATTTEMTEAILNSMTTAEVRV